MQPPPPVDALELACVALAAENLTRAIYDEAPWPNGRPLYVEWQSGYSCFSATVALNPGYASYRLEVK